MQNLMLLLNIIYIFIKVQNIMYINLIYDFSYIYIYKEREEIKLLVKL